MILKKTQNTSPDTSFNPLGFIGGLIKKPFEIFTTASLASAIIYREQEQKASAVTKSTLPALNDGQDKVIHDVMKFSPGFIANPIAGKMAGDIVVDTYKGFRETPIKETVLTLITTAIPAGKAGKVAKSGSKALKNADDLIKGGVKSTKGTGGSGGFATGNALQGVEISDSTLKVLTGGTAAGLGASVMGKSELLTPTSKSPELITPNSNIYSGELSPGPTINPGLSIVPGKSSGTSTTTILQPNDAPLHPHTMRAGSTIGGGMPGWKHPGLNDGLPSNFYDPNDYSDKSDFDITPEHQSEPKPAPDQFIDSKSEFDITPKFTTRPDITTRPQHTNTPDFSTGISPLQSPFPRGGIGQKTTPETSGGVEITPFTLPNITPSINPDTTTNPDISTITSILPGSSPTSYPRPYKTPVINPDSTIFENAEIDFPFDFVSQSRPSTQSRRRSKLDINFDWDNHPAGKGRRKRTKREQYNVNEPPKIKLPVFKPPRL